MAVSNRLACLAPRLLLSALLSAFIVPAACAPKAPPAHPSPSPSPTVAATTATPSATAAANASQTGASQASIRVRSRGTRGAPAQYIERNPAGQIVYDVRSPTAVYNKAPDGTGIADFTQPHVIFHASSGRTVVADSPKAVAHDKDKSVEMSGGVRAKTDDGKILTCATLTYDVLHQQIRCEGDVVLTNTKTNQSASGQLLLTDPDFEHVTLSGSR